MVDLLYKESYLKDNDEDIMTYHESFGYVYAAYKGPMTKDKAVKICQDMSPYLSLPVPHTEDENTFFQKKFRSKYGNIWLGIRIVSNSSVHIYCKLILVAIFEK